MRTVAAGLTLVWLLTRSRDRTSSYLPFDPEWTDLATFAPVPADHLASLICPIPVKPTGAASVPAGSQPYHALPAPDGSRGSPKDTSLVDFVFARRESVGHWRTWHRQGSGP